MANVRDLDAQIAELQRQRDALRRSELEADIREMLPGFVGMMLETPELYEASLVQEPRGQVYRHACIFRRDPGHIYAVDIDIGYDGGRRYWTLVGAKQYGLDDLSFLTDPRTLESMDKKLRLYIGTGDLSELLRKQSYDRISSLLPREWPGSMTSELPERHW